MERAIAPDRKATVGTWDYVLENKDFPAYFIKGWIGSSAPAEEMRRGSGQVAKEPGIVRVTAPVSLPPVKLSPVLRRLI
jgi:hypothetical protein